MNPDDKSLRRFGPQKSLYSYKPSVSKPFNTSGQQIQTSTGLIHQVMERALGLMALRNHSHVFTVQALTCGQRDEQAATPCPLRLHCPL